MTPARETSLTRVDRIAADLAKQIITGHLPALSRLPTVRDLAKRYEINISTVQRVLARLEALGLITVKHGSGGTVCDLRRAGGMDLLPLTLEALESHPERAGKLLADFLEVRRVLAVESIFPRFLPTSSHREATGKPPDLTPVRTAFEEFQSIAGQEPYDIYAAAAADIEVSRCLLITADQTAALHILNVLERAVLANEPLVTASYADPAPLIHLWRFLLEILSNPTRLADQLDHTRHLFLQLDQTLVARFVQALASN